MSKKVKLSALLAGAAIAPWLLTMAGLPSAAQEVFGVTSVINLVFPPGTPTQSLGSFDIGFVDRASGLYLGPDRTKKSIDVTDTSDNREKAHFRRGFVGTVPAASCSTGGANDCAGPDGVLVANGNQVWVGDGNSQV